MKKNLLLLAALGAVTLLNAGCVLPFFCKKEDKKEETVKKEVKETKETSKEAKSSK